MGRFTKTVLDSNGIDRRESGYYSTPEFVAQFMAQILLEINPEGRFALDPCVGKEELIKELYHNDVEIDGFDLINFGDKFYCNFYERNFIDYYKELKSKLFFDTQLNQKYDYYIANPPYNCHEIDYIKNNKNELSQLFKKIGVYNLYSMFIAAMIDCAKEGAVLSLIISDSFLTTKMHNELRNKILNECSIHYLLLCPNDLFLDQKADVRTCIMVLQKGKKYQKKVKTLNRPVNKTELKNSLINRSFRENTISEIINFSQKNEFEFVLDVPTEIQALFNYPRIGDQFHCITGISTGNDAQFLSANKKTGFEIPFYKNPGTRKFYCEPDGYLTNDYLKYDKEIKTFMVRNKNFLLKEGITCSSMGLPFSACYLPEGASFGVNANIFCSKSDIWWLISYLNSRLITYIVRNILIRSNMITSGYVSKIPVIQLSAEAKMKLEKIGLEAYQRKKLNQSLIQSINEIDVIIFQEINLPESIRETITHFSNHLQLSV